MKDPIFQQIVTENGIEIFFNIIGSTNLNIGVKLGFESFCERLEYTACFRFVSDKINPCDTCMIVNEHDKPSFSMRGLDC